MGRRGLAAITVAAGLTLVVAGCTSRGGDNSTSSSASAPPATSSVPSEPPTATVTTSTPPTSEPTATASAPGDACTTDSLTVAAQPGSGASGMQFETVTFTNRGSAACTILGFPGVSLQLSGQALGQPAGRASAEGSPVRLAPGAVARTQVYGPSTCDAPLSDSIRVYPPNNTTFVDVPGELRGCPITVDAITAS